MAIEISLAPTPTTAAVHLVQTLPGKTLSHQRRLHGWPQTGCPPGDRVSSVAQHVPANAQYVVGSEQQSTRGGLGGRTLVSWATPCLLAHETAQQVRLQAGANRFDGALTGEDAWGEGTTKRNVKTRVIIDRNCSHLLIPP